jgi:hypothetical protein
MKLAPHFEALSQPMKKIAEMRSSNEAAGFFMRQYLASWGFDEDNYLHANPDLVGAFPSSAFPDAHAHFISTGYYEGRAPVPMAVDEDWYLATYPDVAQAVALGVLINANERFSRDGSREGRLPADAEIDPRWYAATHMGATHDNDVSLEKCFDHFITIG